MTAYYNEIDPYCVEWLKNLIREGLIADGHVDARSIVEVTPGDLAGFRQVHFFAGIGGWSYAAKLAGWPDDRELWTGSCPCQPFSVAGKGAGQADARHLWPELARLVGACRPAVLFGEQVKAAIGKAWLDGVRADLEDYNYALRGFAIPACSVNAPHRRDRLWFVADAEYRGRETSARSGALVRATGREDGAGYQSPDEPAARNGIGDVADAGGERRQQIAGGAHGDEAANGRRAAQYDHVVAGDGEIALADSDELRAGEERQQRGGQLGGAGRDPWARYSWLSGADGKARRVEPGIRLLAHGVPARVAKLRAFGNAIVPQVAAEILKAYLECSP